MSDPIFKVTSLKDFKKFGFITPSNVALEIITTAILAQLPLVSCHYSRVPIITLDVASVETVLWNGTAESCTGEGYEGGVQIKDAIKKGTGLPSSTSSRAQVEVLKLWKVKKIALATPYNADNNRRLSEYYGSCGFEVVNDSRLDIKNNNDIGDTPLTIYSSIKSMMG